MLKLVLSAGWICAITLVSSYVAASWKTHGVLAPSGGDGLKGLNYTKTAPINVPVISEGSIDGYIVAQFVYTSDAALLNRLSVPPDPFILDEAFGTIFSDERIGADRLERFDVASLTGKILERVNARFGAAVVQDVLVEQLTYVSKDEVRAQAEATAKRPVLVADESIPPAAPAAASSAH